MFSTLSQNSLQIGQGDLQTSIVMLNFPNFFGIQTFFLKAQHLGLTQIPQRFSPLKMVLQSGASFEKKPIIGFSMLLNLMGQKPPPLNLNSKVIRDSFWMLQLERVWPSFKLQIPNLSNCSLGGEPILSQIIHLTFQMKYEGSTSKLILLPSGIKRKICILISDNYNLIVEIQVLILIQFQIISDINTYYVYFGFVIYVKASMFCQHQLHPQFENKDFLFQILTTSLYHGMCHMVLNFKNNFLKNGKGFLISKYEPIVLYFNYINLVIKFLQLGFICWLEDLIIYFISMKRPQSAKPIHNYFPHNNEDTVHEQPLHHFVKAGRKQMFNAMSASNDLSRMLPKKIQQDKERLYCQTLQLKSNLNEITQENLRLKTKIATLQKEKDRLNRTDQPSIAKGRSSNMLNMSVKNEKQNGMVSNLKKMVREYREENQSLKAEISKMKRAIRYTKINEIQVEKQAVFEENQRISRVIGQLQTELETRVRQDEELLRLENELQARTKELKEVTSDNIKYQEILEEVQIRNREANDKLAAQQKKWQKEQAAQKRKIEQLNKQVEMLQQEVKMLNQQLQDEKKKQTQQAKKTIRPASSRPYQQLESASLKIKNTKEKEEALQINQKLKHQLEQAKRKLAESENKLKVASKDTKENLAFSKDQTFELILTKNQANQFMKNDEKEYDSDFEQSPLKAPTNINELPIEQKVKNKSPAKTKKQSNSPIIDDIRQILTFRMKYNRYPYEQLKEDIEVSPLTHFPYSDLLNMLTAEPFYLSQRYSEEFLKVCYGKNKIGINEELDAVVLLQHLRAVIDDFQLFDEQQQGKSLYNIANFMTTHRQELQHRFSRIKDKNECITRQQLTQVLTAMGLSHEQIDLAICYISISTQTLNSIKYMDLLDRFYLNSNSKSLEINDRHKKSAEELSMGQNEDLEEGELIADDQLV